VQVSPFVLEKLKETPELARFFFDEIGSQAEAELWQVAHDRSTPELFERIKTDLPRIIAEGKAASRTDVDKAWAGISFLLAGDSQPFDHQFIVNENPDKDGWGDNLPLVNALWGATPIGNPEEAEISYLTTAEVKEVAKALSKISNESFKERFYRSGIVNWVFPLYGLDGNENDLDYYLAPWYSHLREFYQDAAEKGNAMLISIT
jgi:hypothetical protein